MTKYVVGFAIDRAEGTVALIRKNHPDWQKGLLNGIGGHIEESEIDPIWAMIREFEEEAGVLTSVTHWDRFAVIRGETAVVHFYRSFTIPLDKLKTTTDEQIEITCLDGLSCVVPNLRWLIPMALTPDLNFAELRFGQGDGRGLQSSGD